MSSLDQFLLTIICVSLIVNTAIALYGIFSKPSLIKKFIALTIFSDSVNSFAILIGFRRTYTAFPSIAVLVETPQSAADLQQFIASAVDPTPQALVLTAIVIGLAVNMFIIGLILLYYKYYGTTDVRKVGI